MTRASRDVCRGGRTAPQRRRAAVGAMLAAVLLGVTAGCGARWTDDQREALLARSAGGSEGSAAGRAVGSANESGVGGATTGASGTAGGTAGGTGGGDGAGQGGAASSGAAPCSAPSDAPGVTDDAISVASISTLSGPVPGLGESAEAAVRAYAAYRNATGGVCGREIQVRTGDDGADNGRHRALVTDLSSKVLGLVGGLAAGDAGGADVVAANQMVTVSTPTSETFQNVPVVFDINPPFANVNAATGKYRYLYDQGVRTASLVFIAADQTRAEALGKHKPQMEAAGIRVVNQQELPLSTLSYDAAARGVANSKADYLLFVSDASTGASMARSMEDTGYEPKFEDYLIAYGTNFVGLAGPGAEGATTWIRGLPNEERGNAEQAAFLEWMDRVAPGVPQDTFAVDSWAAAKGFFDSLQALPGPISREALLAQVRSVASFDAGGLIGPIQLGPKLNNGCAIGMRVVSGEWRRMWPEQGFLC